MHWRSELKDSDCLNSPSLLDLYRCRPTFGGIFHGEQMDSKSDFTLTLQLQMVNDQLIFTQPTGPSPVGTNSSSFDPSGFFKTGWIFYNVLFLHTN